MTSFPPIPTPSVSLPYNDQWQKWVASSKPSISGNTRTYEGTEGSIHWKVTETTSKNPDGTHSIDAERVLEFENGNRFTWNRDSSDSERIMLEIKTATEKSTYYWSRQQGTVEYTIQKGNGFPRTVTYADVAPVFAQHMPNWKLPTPEQIPHTNASSAVNPSRSSAHQQVRQINTDGTCAVIGYNGDTHGSLYKDQEKVTDQAPLHPHQNKGAILISGQVLNDTKAPHALNEIIPEHVLNNLRKSNAVLIIQNFPATPKNQTPVCKHAQGKKPDFTR